MPCARAATHKPGYGYKGSGFYEVMPHFAIIGGDITKVGAQAVGRGRRCDLGEPCGV